MTVVALQARVRSVELDSKEQRSALEKVESLQAALARSLDRLTKRVDDLGDAGGDKAKARIEAMEARVAETTRMQLELAAHDDRIEALEEGVPGASGDSGDELLSLDGRLGALEARLGESDSAEELERRLQAAEVGLADAQRALGAAQVELGRRDATIAELVTRLEALESGRKAPVGAPGGSNSDSASGIGSRASDSEVGGRESDSASETQSRESDSEIGRRRSASEIGSRASELESDPGSRESGSESDSPSASGPAPSTPGAQPAGDPVSLTDVKGIGPKLSKKLSAAGLDDARRLAAMDDAGLDALADSSGVKRGRLERLRDAARAL